MRARRFADLPLDPVAAHGFDAPPQQHGFALPALAATLAVFEAVVAPQSQATVRVPAQSQVPQGDRFVQQLQSQAFAGSAAGPQCRFAGAQGVHPGPDDGGQQCEQKFVHDGQCTN